MLSYLMHCVNDTSFNLHLLSTSANWYKCCDYPLYPRSSALTGSLGSVQYCNFFSEESFRMPCCAGCTEANQDNQDDTECTKQPLLSRIRHCTSNDGNFPPPAKQRFTIAGLLISDLTRCMALQLVTRWIPWTMILYDPMFARKGIPKPDNITLR